jgi:hypothetical protein
MTKSLAGLLLLIVLLAGAGCSTVTNLTPSRQKREASGLYPFAVDFGTHRREIQKETLTPYVALGNELYPMEKSPGPYNRWETFVPIPADKKVVHYRYKFDYRFNTIPEPKPSSRLSDTYQLEIIDP